ncbi:SAM-dependent methyltransferase [Allostella vacuolata]|nr:SAM-dependent methyltransferase [Stella vacuolata]
MAPRHAPATARNREAILEVLAAVLPETGLLLEVASGTGEHAAYMAPRLGGGISWQPTDGSAEALADIDAHARASGCERIRPALRLDASADRWPVARADAILCCNMIHIAPWSAAEGLFAGAARVLAGDGAPLVLYGPFRRDGRHTATSNAEFDASLQARDPAWGIRCLDQQVEPLARRHGFHLAAVRPMPANNLTAIFRVAGECESISITC